MLTERDGSLESLYEKFMSFNTLMMEDHSPLEVAAIMVTQGLTYYRTILDEDEYQRMVKSIYDSRDKVKRIEA